MTLYRFAVHINGREKPASFILRPETAVQREALQMLADLPTSLSYSTPEKPVGEFFVMVEELRPVDAEELALEDLRDLINDKFPGGGVGMQIIEGLPGVFEGRLHLSKGTSVQPLCSALGKKSRLAAIAELIEKMNAAG